MPATTNATTRIEAPARSLGLDLLRALAVMMVLVSHWTSHFGYWFGIPVPAVVDVIGDTGVEIFFALSGFLIGRILIGIAEAGPSWRDYRVFMIRRAMRTLPLYFLWLTFLLCVFPPKQDFVVTALRFMTLTQNLIADMPADYYFVVTWSLTIEEWFYLLFGFCLILLSRRFGSPRALTWCLAGFMVAPLTLRLVTSQRSPLVFFRIDEIAYGVLMARLYLNNSKIFRHPWSCLGAGLALIAACLSAALPIPATLAIPLTSSAEVIGSALCLPAALRLVSGASWFEIPVRWIAMRSYALYLIHLTILVNIVEKETFEPRRLPVAACVFVAMALPFVLAELSYRLLEAPMLHARPSQRATAVATGCAVAAAKSEQASRT